ncbi:MAG: hypothetical protein JSR60_07080 [Proteobacteria bacterium]|nr:hypothetical protein [Pseudomonadota bacterium]
MVAIDNTMDAQPRTESHPAPIIAFAAFGAAALAAVSLLMSHDGNGWKSAADAVSRFSMLLFVAAMTVEPLSRLVPRFEAIGRERTNLVLAFVAASFAAIACVAAPHFLLGETLTVPAAAYCLVNGFILTVLLFCVHQETRRVLGAPAWRAIQRVATSYFWTVFVLIGVDKSIGPHIPDPWPGFSLLLLTAAFLLRFVDAFVQHRHARAA